MEASIRGNLRCVREFSLAMLTGPTRVLASFWLSHSAQEKSVERVFALIDTRSRMEDGTESVEGQIIGLTWRR